MNYPSSFCLGALCKLICEDKAHLISLLAPLNVAESLWREQLYMYIERRQFLARTISMTFILTSGS